MANLGDIAGLVFKTVGQNSYNVADTVKKTVDTVKQQAVVSAIKAKYKPGQIISPEDTAIIQKVKVQPIQQPKYPSTVLEAPKGDLTKPFQLPQAGFAGEALEKPLKTVGKALDYAAGTYSKGLKEGVSLAGEKIQQTGEEFKRRVDVKLQQEPKGSITREILERGRSIFETPMEQAGIGLQQVAGVNRPQEFVKGLAGTVFGALGATPAGAVFNGIIGQPEVKPIAEKAFGLLDSAKTAVKSLPLVKDLPEEAKAALDVGIDLLAFKAIHETVKAPFKTTKTIEMTHPETGEMVQVKVPVDTEGWRMFKQDLASQISALKKDPIGFLKQQQVGMSIKDISSNKLPIKPEALNSEAAAQITSELSNAQAGKRFGVDGETVSYKSTFPDWIPDDLRKTPLVKAVMESLQEGTVPKFKKQLDLYNIVKDRIETEFNKTLGTEGWQMTEQQAKDLADRGFQPKPPITPEKAPTALETGLKLGENVRPTKEFKQFEKEIVKPNVDVSKFDADKYVQDMVEKQKAAAEKPSVGKTISNFLMDVKRKIVDSSSPIEDLIAEASKKYQYDVLPKNQLNPQISRVLKAPTLAGQFVKEGGLADVIAKVPDVNKLDQYLIAKQALKIEERGKATGRDLVKDRMLTQALAPEYEQYAKQVTDYSTKILDKAVTDGLIDKDLAVELKRIYPDYVPIKRVFNELEKAEPTGTSKALASLSKQTVIEKLQGSEKEIESPIESLMGKTYDVFNQGEKNRAAQILADYRTLPGFEGKIVELKPGETAVHSFSYLDNGVKRTFKTTPEIAQAAKRLNVEEAGLLIKVLRAPVRIFKAGTTGLEPSFALVNVIKDQMTAFINSKHALKTSAANPVVFTKALFSALKHDELYNEMVRNAGGGTSFDVIREQAPLTIEQIRSKRNLGSRISYIVKNPASMLRAVEDTIGRSEEFTRLQQYIGTKEALIKEGRTPEDAAILAGKAARENTADFSRKGEWGDVLNTIPYFNASLQGSRALIRSFARDPASTTLKVAATVFLPIAAATAWNLSDPERKKVYDDILDYEKEGSFILIPPNPTKDEKTGKWNVIKVPMAPGASSLSVPVRKTIEGAYNTDPLGAGLDVLNSILETVSPLSLKSPSKFLGNITPQIIKPALEVVTNRDLFREAPIIPQSLQGLSPELQTKANTTDTAKFIGNLLGISPIQVDHIIAGYGGKLATEVTGGLSPVEAVTGRFTKATGGVETGKAYEAINAANMENKDYNFLLKQSVDKLLETKDKEGMVKLYETLDPEKQSYVKQYIKDKVTTKPDATAQAISTMNADQAVKYYGTKLDDAIKTKDKATMLQMVNSLQSDSAKKDFLKYIITRKDELAK